MHSKLIDSLKAVNYPLTILSNYPQSGSQDGEKELMKLVEQADCKHSVTLQIDYENAKPWSDDILCSIHKDNGLIVLHICQEDDTWHFAIAAQYTPDEISKLRINRNIGSRLHARCHMMIDVTQPLLLNETNQSVDDHTTSLSPDASALKEISFLENDHCLFSSDSIAVYLFKGREAPAVMRLIGIGRAIAFTAIGAGSGQEIDLSEEDEYYDHLMLWDKNALSLVGAYRIGFTEEVINELGTGGLYLDHVFDFKKEFHEQMGNAMELSRSFVLPSYQKNPQMLDTLWKGLGMAAVAKNCYTLYGSVTISASFTPLSQAILVDTLRRYHGEAFDLRKYVNSKHPFIPTTQNHALVSTAWSELGMNKLNSVIEDIEQNQRSIPPLVRYYVTLGAKFLAFQVEESFNNAIYCLLRVNLRSLPKRYKKRFLGDSSQI